MLLEPTPRIRAATPTGSAFPDGALFRPPLISAAEISPDGTHIAVILHKDSGVVEGAVMDAQSGQAEPITQLPEGDGRTHLPYWKGNQSILFDSVAGPTQNGYNLHLLFGRPLIFDLKTHQVTNLFPSSPKADIEIVDLMAADPDRILVYNRTLQTLSKFNLRTGEFQVVGKIPTDDFAALGARFCSTIFCAKLSN